MFPLLSAATDPALMWIETSLLIHLPIFAADNEYTANYS